MNSTSNVKKIVDENKEYAMIIDFNNLPQELKFYTDDGKFIQIASWKYDKGHETKPHSHKEHEKISNITQEFVYVKKGSLEVTLYNDNEQVIAQEILKQGMCIITFYGGHKYKILEDNTEVLEIKNGPYHGLDKDKKVIENG